MVHEHRRKFINRDSKALSEGIFSFLLRLFRGASLSFLLLLHYPLQALLNALLGQWRHSPVVLSYRQVILEPHSQPFMLCAFIYITQQRNNVQLIVRQDDISTRIELQKQMVKAVGELKFYYAIRANLRNRSYSSSLEGFAQLLYKWRGRRCCGPYKARKMASEARVYNELFSVVGFLELKKEYTRGEVINVSYSKSSKATVKLVGNDLRVLANGRTAP